MKSWCNKNRKKVREKHKKYRDSKENYPEIQKDRCLKLLFGISLEEYKTLFLLQNGVCAICKCPETSKHNNGIVRQLSVDHCHKTKKVRGLLCSKCNLSLGGFGDSKEILMNALQYLTQER